MYFRLHFRSVSALLTKEKSWNRVSEKHLNHPSDHDEGGGEGRKDV